MNSEIEGRKKVDLKFNDPENLVLIDGSGYIFRAFYGLPPMTNSNGIPVNAVFGFTKMLMKLIDDFKPNYMGVIFDVSRKTFRNDLYEKYKANRSEPPEELIPQFSLIRDAAHAIGLPVFAKGGGLMYLTGPTSGYLYGMVVAVAVIGFFADKGYAKSYVKSFLAIFSRW